MNLGLRHDDPTIVHHPPRKHNHEHEIATIRVEDIKTSSIDSKTQRRLPSRRKSERLTSLTVLRGVRM